MTPLPRALSPRFRSSLVPQHRGCAAPLMHLNGLRVLQHLREVGVDNLLEELVLGGTWRRHDDLDLSENSSKQEQRTIA